MRAADTAAGEEEEPRQEDSSLHLWPPRQPAPQDTGPELCRATAESGDSKSGRGLREVSTQYCHRCWGAADSVATHPAVVENEKRLLQKASPDTG